MNLNKKGFVLTETLMVAVFIITIFTFIFTSVIPLLGIYKDMAEREENIDIVYKLYSIRKMLKKDENESSIINNRLNKITCNDLADVTACSNLMDFLELENYELLYIKNISSSINDSLISDEMRDYLEDYKEEEHNAIALLDKDKHTMVHLKYNDDPLPAADMLLKNIENQNACISSISYNGPYSGDLNNGNVLYYTGSDENCLKNYVWYSGKLWRIVVIYPNGMIKLVTENPMTSIYYGSSTTFDNSYIDQWLNEEFLPTLYNNENIVVQNAEWNVKTTTATTDPYLERVTKDTINKTVGLLNAFEYTKSGTRSGYLHIGQYWWLMTPYSSSFMRLVDKDGYLGNFTPHGEAYGVRPSIVIKSSVTFDTKNYDGTRLLPFHIVGDIEEGKKNELLNTRISGEYVKFNNELYRIVGIENSTTKIVNTSYINNPNSSNTSDTTLGDFGSDGYFNTQSTDMKYWDKYLTDENGWLDTISASEKALLVNGTYYLGLYPNRANYKVTICKNTASELETTTISNCMKYEDSDTNKIYKGLVGLLRAGEMMSTQQSTLAHVNDSSHYKGMWLITPKSSTTIHHVYNDGRNIAIWYSSFAYAVRPSVNIKSETKITGGSGFINDPYEIACTTCS